MNDLVNKREFNSIESNGPVVGPGALKPTVGDGKKSSQLLVHIVIDILIFYCAPILVCVIIIIIIIIIITTNSSCQS